MRLCRFGSENAPRVGFYDERRIVPLKEAIITYSQAQDRSLEIPAATELLPFLPGGRNFAEARDLAGWVHAHPDRVASFSLETDKTRLLVPVPRPNKIFLLAGNYADHIREGGGIAAERAETFPYVFMKPPSTTLTHPGAAIKIPRAAPDAVDWELELAVVIGRRAKHVTEADALNYVAGYTVLNDISQRRYRPNPVRKKREKDGFFDWLHGKWFDSFCPVGPCVASADAIPDPQALRMKLELNDIVKQDASTAQQIFPVAAVIAFIAEMVTLEAGDLISTGTPAGVGSTTGTFLKPGDVMRGSIERIGQLVTPVEMER
ncbi:MAG: fumarylacetoacetate hydrolase family protein [Planctomycetes bacterium]|nr:fumarylacetoacetate hydrolase family protein [Planctomycetota bacterium]